MLNYTNPYNKVVIVGKQAKQKVKQLYNSYLPNTLIYFSDKEKNLPLLEGRFVEGKTYIYVCEDNYCKLPVKTIEEQYLL